MNTSNRYAASGRLAACELSSTSVLGVNRSAQAVPPTPALDSAPRGTASARPSVRLFFALWPGPRVRLALARCRDQLIRPDLAWPIPTDKLHLTLHFIGNVPSVRVPEIASGLQVPVRGFELQLDVAESWNSGLTVLQPLTVPTRLLELHADLAAALRRLALLVEARPFRPHVTLLRRCAPRQPGALAEPLRWRVTGCVLVESTASGSYELVRRYR